MAPPVPGYKAWYDASQIGSLSTSTGLVFQMQDLSGNGLHVSQASGTEWPTLGSTINGMNVLSFDGVDDRLDCGTSFGLATSTIFVVSQAATTGADRIMVDGVSPGGRHVIMRSGTTWDVYQGSAVIGSVASDLLPHVHTGIFTGSTTSGARTDGVAGTTGSAGTNTLAGFRIGGEFTGASSNMWAGTIGEVIVYAGVMVFPDIVKVEQYLQQKWRAGVAGWFDNYRHVLGV